MQHKTDWKNGDIVDAVAVNRIETNAKELEIGKVDKEDGKQLSSNDYTDSEKEKLAAIEEGATNYQHPSSHPSSMITYIDNKGIGGTDLQTVVDLVSDKVLNQLIEKRLISNNLTTTNDNMVLGAPMGKLLKEQLDEQNNNFVLDYSSNPEVSSWAQAIQSMWDKIYQDELVGLVPIMTSNTTPSGCARVYNDATDFSDYSSEYKAYFMFDGNTNTLAGTGGNNAAAYPHYYEYDFGTTKLIHGFRISGLHDRYNPKDILFQYSNDYIIWNTLFSNTLPSGLGDNFTYCSDLDKYARGRYWRIKVISGYYEIYNWSGIYNLQFLGE